MPRSSNAVAPEAQIEYLDALERELTAEVQRGALLYAQRLAHGLARSGVRVDPDFAQHLAQDAISDTALGDRPWSPAACSLAGHLRGVIRSRVGNFRRHERSFPRAGLELQDDNAAPLHDAAPHAAPARLTALRDLARRVLLPLYGIAADRRDHHVTALLDAYADGVSKRAEAAEHAYLSIKEYDRARERLAGMVATLPEDLRHDIAETLRSQS